MLLFTHPAMLRHDPGPGRLERPPRLQYVLRALEDLSLDRRKAPPASRAAVQRVHPDAFVTDMEAAFSETRNARVHLTPDTAISSGSREAAYRAAGACVAAVDSLLAGEDETAFCAVRPPGHHAEPARAMGFCVFSNVAIAARHALDHHGLRRVAVVDFDVHHGNGTQRVAEADSRLFFGSTHQFPLYPGTGRADETGPVRNVVNAPLSPGSGSGEWREAMERRVLPALDAFRPELVIVSAGFDAHRADPAADMELEADDYAWAAEGLREIAREHAGGRVMAALEGGYDLDALAASARAFVKALAA